MAKRGRRTAYDPMFCEMIIDYFEKAAEAPVRELAAVTTSQADAKGGYQKSEVRRICAELPTIEGFSRSIGFPSGTVKQWAADHPEFGDAYARAKDIQYQVLVDRGLTRQYDATAFQFVAKNITGMTDRVNVEASGPDGGPLVLQVFRAGTQPDPE